MIREDTANIIKNKSSAKDVKKCVTTSDRKVTNSKEEIATVGYCIGIEEGRMMKMNISAKKVRNNRYATDWGLK
jgi:hypothetical protein